MCLHQYLHVIECHATGLHYSPPKTWMTRCLRVRRSSCIGQGASNRSGIGRSGHICELRYSPSISSPAISSHGNSVRFNQPVNHNTAYVCLLISLTTTIGRGIMNMIRGGWYSGKIDHRIDFCKPEQTRPDQG